MYLVLYCHNIGMTDFSFLESEDFAKDEGYCVRGKWPNEQAFRQHLPKELGDLSTYRVIDLISQGASAEQLSPQELQRIADEQFGV